MSVTSDVRSTSFVQRAVTYSGANVIGQAALMAQAFVVRRILPPEVLGIWSFAAVVRQFVTNFDPGVLTAAARELPIAQGKGDQAEVNRIRSTVIWSAGIQASLMAVAIIIYAWVKAGDFSSLQTTALYLAASVALFTILVSVYITFFQGAEHYVPLSRVLLIGSLLDTVLLPAGAYFQGLPGLMVAAVIAWLVKLAFLVRMGWRLGLGPRLRAGVDFGKLKSLLAFGFPLRILEYPLGLFLIADLLLVSRFFTVGELAIYAMAKNFVNQVSDIGIRVGTVFITRLYVLSGQGEPQAAIAQRLESFTLFQFLVAVPLLACLAFVGVGFLVREVIPAYESGMDIFQVLLITMFFMPQMATIRFPLMYDRDLRQIGVSNAVAVGSIVALFLSAVLIAGEVTLLLVAQMMVLGHMAYFVYLIVVVGRKLWGVKRTAMTLGMVLVAAIWTATILAWLSPDETSFNSIAGDLVWSLVTMTKLVFLILPLLLLGLWRAGLLRPGVTLILSGRKNAGALPAKPGAREPDDLLGEGKE